MGKDKAFFPGRLGLQFFGPDPIKTKPTWCLKRTGFETYGLALGKIALRNFHRDRTGPHVSKGKVMICKLKQSAPTRFATYGLAPPQRPLHESAKVRMFQEPGSKG